jgi:hypothetical protein
VADRDQENATGLPRLVIRIYSPCSARKSKSKNSWLAWCALTVFILVLFVGYARASDVIRRANTNRAGTGAEPSPAGSTVEPALCLLREFGGAYCISRRSPAVTASNVPLVDRSDSRSRNCSINSGNENGTMAKRVFSLLGLLLLTACNNNGSSPAPAPLSTSVPMTLRRGRSSTRQECPRIRPRKREEGGTLIFRVT